MNDHSFLFAAKYCGTLITLFVVLALVSGCSEIQRSTQRPFVEDNRVTRANSPEEAIQALVSVEANIARTDVSIYQSEIDTSTATATIFHKAYVRPDPQTGLRGGELLCVSRLHLLQDGWSHDAGSESTCVEVTFPQYRGIQCAVHYAVDLDRWVVFGRVHDPTVSAIEVTKGGEVPVRIETKQEYFFMQLHDSGGLSVAATNIQIYYEEMNKQVTNNIDNACFFVEWLSSPR